MSKQTCAKTVLTLVAMAMLALPAAAAGVPKHLPDPDGKPADQTKKVQLFILLGQSNMLGFGGSGKLSKEAKNRLAEMDVSSCRTVRTEFSAGTGKSCAACRLPGT